MPPLRRLASAIEPMLFRFTVFLMMAMMDDPAMLAMWFF